jgi:predicted N-acetyltransferase YhbS
MKKMEFRSYKSDESKTIESLFTSVFEESEGEAEGRLIGNLARDLILNTDPVDMFVFVAAEGDSIIGTIFLTRMPSEIESEIFILGPVAILTARQGMGVGQGLIKYGIKELKDRGVKIIATYGDPSFYTKVGFEQINESNINPPLKLSHPEGWLAQSLSGSPIEVEGKCSCVSALNDAAYW